MPNLRGKTWTTTTPANVEDAQYWEDHLISDTAAAKAASSVQSVNSITPDQYGNVEIGNAGHTIQDDDGNDMPKQDVLQFVNADVTNDTVNEKTVVDCKGAKGDAATITVGTVTTLPAGSSATVTNSGTTSAAVFDFGIPKGADGTGSVDSVNGYTGTVVLDASDVGALPDSTTIPTKTSELDNDSGFVTSSAIPTSLSELSDDSTHRLVTDAEKTAWDAKVSESLLKDTVGWVGKNDLKITFDDAKEGIGSSGWNGRTYTIGNLTLTVNADMTFTLNGSHTADVVLVLHNRETANNNLKAGTYKFLAEGSTNEYFTRFFTTRNNSAVVLGDINSNRSEFTADVQASDIMGVLINYTANTSISNVTIKPMITDASITDSTFEPYHKSVEDWYWENNPNAGVHNIFDTANKKGGNATTTTITNNGKNIQVTSNSSTYANSTWYLNVEKNTDYVIKADVAITSGLARLKVQTNGGTAIAEGSSVTTNGKIELAFNSGDNEQITFVIFVTFATAEVANVMFNNMFIKLASDTVDYYTDYAMTNRELTDAVTQNETTVELETGITKWTENVICKQGKVCFMNLTVSGTFTANTEVLVGTIPANYRPRQILFFPLCTTNGYGFVKVGQDGTIKMNNVSGNATNLGVFGSWLVP